MRAISREKVVGPYFFEDENVDSENHRNTLTNYAFLRFASPRKDYIFHQDGALVHYFFHVRRYLDSKRPRKWVRRGGSEDLLHRSADLTPCDFFSLGTLERKDT